MLRAKKSQPGNNCVPKARLRKIEGGNRGDNGRMASPTQWIWIWASSGRLWGTGKPGVFQFTGLQRVGHDLATEKQQRTKVDTKIHSITVIRSLTSLTPFFMWLLTVSSPLPFWPTSGQTDEDGPSLPPLALAGHSNHARPHLCGRTVLPTPHPKHNKTPSQPPSLLPPDIAGPVGSLFCSPQKATWCE